MRLNLTTRERQLLIGVAIVLALATFVLFAIVPLKAAIAEQRNRLAVARANLDLARQADANTAGIARRIADLSEALDSLSLPLGDHQASLLRRLDDLARSVGVRVEGVVFDGSQANAGEAATASAGAGTIGLTIRVLGSPAACVDFVARTEALPDLIVETSNVTTTTQTTGTLTGYLIHAPR